MEQPAVAQVLERYQINEKFGFLAPECNTKLPSKLQYWEQLVDCVPTLGEKLYSSIDQLQDFDVTCLTTESQWRRAFVVLTILSNAYVWTSRPPKRLIPKKISVPLVKVAEKFDLKPIVCQASLVLWNWRLRDETKPFSLDNIAKVNGFLEEFDEDWFYMVTCDIEYKGAITLQLIIQMLLDLQSGCCDKEMFRSRLAEIERVIQECTATLKRMGEKCDPSIFYNKLRPYLSGSLHNPQLPELIYEDCFGGAAQHFAGGSAAQSTLIQAWDAFFSVQHKDSAAHYLNLVRQYMPKPHREFLSFIENSTPSLRTYVKQTNDEGLTKNFDACLDSLSAFRAMHLNIVGRYIIAQGSKSESGEQPRGTGGTSVVPFLKTSRDATNEARINRVKQSQ